MCLGTCVSHLGLPFRILGLLFCASELAFTMGSCLSVPVSVPASVPTSINTREKERYENAKNALSICKKYVVKSSKKAEIINTADLNYKCPEFVLQINDIHSLGRRYTVCGVSQSNCHGHIIGLESTADGDELFSSWEEFVNKIRSILGKSS